MYFKVPQTWHKNGTISLQATTCHRKTSWFRIKIPNLETIISRFQPLNFGGSQGVKHTTAHVGGPPSRHHAQDAMPLAQPHLRSTLAPVHCVVFFKVRPVQTVDLSACTILHSILPHRRRIHIDGCGWLTSCTTCYL